MGERHSHERVEIVVGMNKAFPRRQLLPNEANTLWWSVNDFPMTILTRRSPSIVMYSGSRCEVT
jgi:hypothetical protein